MAFIETVALYTLGLVIAWLVHLPIEHIKK